MSSPKPTIAFFGATGGCALNALVCALKDGYKAVALARTPSKLTNLLTQDHSLSQSTLSNLTIIRGSVSDLPAVKSVLSTHSPSIIISGLGGSPRFQWSLTQPCTLDQPTICADGAALVVAALKELRAEGKLATRPLFVVVSTTGLSPTRDVPWAFYGLYHWLLAVPHVDKKKMEETVVGASVEADPVVDGFVVVRPTLLNDSPKGVENVRSGWERHWMPGAATEPAGPGPALGYFIARADVGGWIFENVVKAEREDVAGRCFSLTG